MAKPEINVCWLRRDLRLQDNAALYYALKEGRPVLPLFIFDRNILDQLENKEDRRVEFIYETLRRLQQELLALGSSLEVHYGFPLEIMRQLADKYSIDKVFCNTDYEPYAAERDEAVARLLKENNIGFASFKDQVIFDKDEVLKDDGSPYTVFTPYSKKWKARLNDFYLKPYPVEIYTKHFYQQQPQPLPSLEQMGFRPISSPFPSSTAPESIIRNYSSQRDFPGIDGTSRLSVHLRFGTISIRALVAKAVSWNQTYLNELIWREFYQMILWHFPRVGKGFSFKPEYDAIRWRNNEQEFKRWCEGKTGYPIVDAGMRELNATGYMHNRVRMIVASFLTKDLLIDWRWGEAYFAEKLLDFDLAANNGGWQWAAGSGCDAAPYFRVFNPWLQTKKFDPDLKYIRKWVPELDSFDYPQPMVDHNLARERCLEAYSVALKKNG
jgi:deoxyribodipyrimidine photo-lyase